MNNLNEYNAKAEAEYQEVLKWAADEEEKVVSELKSEGAIMGLIDIKNSLRF